MARQLDKEEMFSEALTRAMGQLGLFGIIIPEEYGGHGLDYLAYAIACEEIARVDGSQAATVTAHNSLGDQSALLFRQRSTAQEVCSATLHGREALGLRVDRARRRIRLARQQDVGHESRRRLENQRRQDFHHQRRQQHKCGRDSASGHWLERRRQAGTVVLHRRARRQGIFLAPDARQGGVARRRIPPSCISRMYSCPTRTCSVNKVTAPGRCFRHSTAASSASPPWASAARREHTKRRWHTPMSASNSARPSPAFSQLPLRWPTCT